MEDGIIKESELVQLDGTIDKLIQSISDLSAEYASAVASIKQSATTLAESLKSVSGATRQGRRAIDENAKAASRLQAAYDEFGFALSETGKQVALLKAETRSINKATVEQQKYIEEATARYARVKNEVSELTRLYMSLTDAEHDDVNFGGQVLAELRAKKAEFKALNDEMKPVVQSMTLLQKTEQQLAYWQSDEGKQVLALRAQIRELTKERKAEKVEVTALEEAQQKLAFERSDDAKELAKLNEEIRQQQEYNRALAKELLYAGHGYKDYSSQLRRTLLDIEALDESSEDYATTLEKLTNRAAYLRAQMNAQQQAVGNYSLNVGNYKSAFDGLGQATQQVLRELPTLRIGLDQFFLAISNNIPIFADMYAAEKQSFEGQKEDIRLLNSTIDEATGEIIPNTAKINAEIAKLDTPIKKVAKSIFSWRTALVIVTTVFTLWGEEILSWIGSLFKGTNALYDLRKATKAVNEELKTNAHGYDDNMVTFRKLQREWKTLKTEAEKTKWIKDNESAWSKLDVAMTDVADAEDLFVRNTATVQKAFMLRAKAAAAEELAKKKYAELLKLEVQREQQENTKKFLDSQLAAQSGPYAMTVSSPTTGSTGTNYAAMAAANALALKSTNSQIDAINSEVEAYFKLSAAARAASDEIIGLYSKRDKSSLGSLFDLEEYIAKMRVKVSESADKEQVKSARDSFRQREKEAIKERNSEVNMLTEVQRKNKEILDLRLKDSKALTAKEKKILKELTPERVAILEEENEKIVGLLEKFKAAYDQIITDILTEEKIARINTEKEILDYRLEFAQEGSFEELAVKLRVIELEKQAALLANEMVADAEKKNVDEIIKYYNKLALEARGAASLALANVSRTEMTATYTQALSRTGVGQTRKQRRQARRTARKEYGTEGSLRREVYEIDTQLLDINEQLELYDNKRLNLSREQVAQLKLQKAELEDQKFKLAGKDDKVSGFENFMHSVNENGFAGGLLEALGLDEEGIEAFNVAVDAVIDGLSQIIEAEIEAAEQAVEAAQERVSAAQAAYDAEIEARNNGYANSVDTARKELENEKENEKEKQKMLEQARKKQQALDAVTQASSLVTAVAGLWASYSTMGPASIALAGIATAALFASFIASQVKAAQVAKQAYGEGGLEFLEGGSHASGNDIPLGTVNSEGKSMVAEGGEAMAIINKRNTRRYKHILPDIVESLNKGTFEEKFLNAFRPSNNMTYNISSPSRDVDLSDVEDSLHDIRNQGKSRAYTLSDGTVIVYYKNLKRIIRN